MRILFITGTRIGDAVLTAGAIRAVAQTRMAREMWVACGPAPAPLMARVEGVTRVIPLKKRRFGLHWLHLWRLCVLRRWDLVIDMRGSGLSFLLLAKERRVARRPSGIVHRAEHAADVAGLKPAPPPRLIPTADDRVAARAALGDDPRPILALAPAANWSGKIWPAARFAELAARLTAHGGALEGVRTVLLAGPGEEALAAKVADLLDDAFDLSGRLDLPKSVAVMERAVIVVANDSGLMHAAAAVGARTLGLFGPTDERLYGPVGALAASVRGPTRPDIAARANGDDVEGPKRMAELSVDAALRMAHVLLAKDIGRG